jgi:hypothetical protein
MFRICEKVFHKLNEANDARTTIGGDYYTAYLRYDDIVGPKGAPNVRVRSFKKRDGQLIYDATYGTDDCGRRVTHDPAPGRKREQFIAFFGCSYTFGEGLEDGETLPSQVADLAPAYRVYNYGCSGYGPQQMLAKLETGQLLREIAERSGIFIYVFIPHHVRRAIGSMRVATKWGRTFPNYVLDANGNLVRDGDFVTGRPHLARVYTRLSNIDTLRFFGIDVPLFITKKHLDFTTRILKQAKRLAERQFENTRFYVLLYPDPPEGEMSAKRMVPFLQQAGIDYLDFTELLDVRQPEFRIKGDDHPTGLTHQEVASELVRRIIQNSGTEY